MKTVAAAAADAEEEGRRRHRQFMMRGEDNVFKKFLASYVVTKFQSESYLLKL